MNIDPLYDLFTGRCIRKIAFQSAPANAVYLTFDDGPTAHCTPQVLDLLARHNVKATFFLIGKNAGENSELTKRILLEGHRIGNHTIDHDTKHYMGGVGQIAKWVKSSQDFFEHSIKVESIGFRSPLGIKTPPLNKVLAKMKMPLILWDVRFYDTKYGLSKDAVEKKLSSINPGSIILLHDCHVGKKQDEFLEALEYLLVECLKKNLQFIPLEKSYVTKTYEEKYSTKL